MDLQHTFTVPIGVEEAWDAFTDIARIAPCLPGAAITSVDGDEFTGTAKVKLGPISLQYTGKGSWVSRDHDGYRAVLEAQGKDKRGNGTAGATIAAQLEPDGTGTRVVVDTELKITGRPAQFGRGVIQDVGTKLLDQFAACLATRLVEPASVGGDDTVDGAAGATAGGPGPVPTSGPPAAAPVTETSAATPPSATPRSAPPSAASSASATEPMSSSAAQPSGTQSSSVPPTSSWADKAGDAYPGPTTRAAASEPAELDLGGVVGPVLLKRLLPVAVGAVALGLLVRWLRRR
ncbi:MAG TPA: SRPBCC domain-containing protein [Actinomycetales bacterium]|nr:SRPBCC domain-containing protein [Actinomycetales bacterium]